MAAPFWGGGGGPGGAGKTSLGGGLCKRVRDTVSIAGGTNDIYPPEDAEYLARAQALPLDRIVGVETGTCPHTAIREDASMNFEAIDRLSAAFPDLELVFVESGGDNLSASFSPELVDVSIYVIDVAA